MSSTGEPWVIVLAAGEGRRIGAFTRNAQGLTVPKQYCSFGVNGSLLRRTLDRARGLAPLERIVTIVAEAHRAWWEPELGSLLPGNVVVQPSDRGTASGILLPLIHVLKRDPGATIVVVPSDHHVEDEGTLRLAVEDALRAVRAEPARLVLLGIEPDEADVEYGWILPARSPAHGTRSVERFVEKPSSTLAAELLAQGAVWNSFIFAGAASTILSAYGRALPELLEPFLRDLVVLPREGALAELYARVPVKDFSRDVLERLAGELRYVSVRRCGWIDLGTPRRLRRFLGLDGARAADGGAGDEAHATAPLASGPSPEGAG